MMKVDGPGAYAPGSTVVPIMERIRDGRMLEPIKADVLLRASLTTPSLAPRTIQSLKLLDVIDDDGHLTAPARKFSGLSTPEYKPALRDLLQRVYADVFAVVEPAEASYEQVQDAFRAFTPKGQRDRMVSLFLALLEYAEYSDTLPKARPTGPPMKSGNGSSANGSGTRRRTSGAAGGDQRRRNTPQGEKDAKGTKGTPQSESNDGAEQPPPHGDNNTFVVQLGQAGTVTLTANLDMWRLDDEDMEFFVELRKRVRAHQAKRPNPPADHGVASEDIDTDEEDSS